MPEWSIVIPVKGAGSAKSRLGGSPELARAIALDSVSAALEVARVIVVTTPGTDQPFVDLGAEIVPDADGGLLVAVRHGITAAGSGAVAVLLGDVPALKPGELTAALEQATHHRLAFVPDADDEGTVLITALSALDHRPAFGPHSRAAHLAAGYAELAIPVASGLRRDVDTPAQLAALAHRVGPHTRAAL